MGCSCVPAVVPRWALLLEQSAPRLTRAVSFTVHDDAARSGSFLMNILWHADAGGHERPLVVTLTSTARGVADSRLRLESFHPDHIHGKGSGSRPEGWPEDARRPLKQTNPKSSIANATHQP